MKKSKTVRVEGSDNYGYEASLDIQRVGSSIKIYSSEEGGPVVFSVREARNLIEVLQRMVKECLHAENGKGMPTDLKTGRKFGILKKRTRLFY